MDDNKLACPACGYIFTDMAPPTEPADTHYQAIKGATEEAPYPAIEYLPALEKDEIALKIAGNPHLIRLKVHQIIVFGRNFAGDSFSETQLDLAALEAHNLGVSRRHACLEKIDDNFFLTDLNSSNGTLLNDERLEPNKAYLLLSGARIQLGRLKMLLFYGEYEHDSSAGE
ncbi:MAG: FHA domain-containing protein [Chloroflexi bacterium]|nr:FHA domain-containing protein [Chloroflexota bacterium]